MNENMTDSRTLFFSPEEEKDFQTVLKDVQEYISSKYSTLIMEEGGEDAREQIKRYITKYVQDYRIAVKGMSGQELVDRYKRQLEYYERALQQMTGKTVKEKIIYSLKLQEEICL